MPRLVRDIIRDYRWIHLSIGIFGNATFVVGSVFFLFESLKRAGTWLFILGTLGMLIGSIGELILKLKHHD